MDILRSFRALIEAVREDSDFRRLGFWPGWSVYYRYLGRWYDRRGKSMPYGTVNFTCRGQKVWFEMSNRYLGAFAGVFLDEEYDCGTELESPPRRILDLGGNIGFGSVYLSKLFPGAEIVAIEPDPRNMPLLRTNLQRNHVDAHVISGAVGPRRGRLALRYGDDPACSSLVGTGMHDLAHSLDVEIITVQDIMNQVGWRFVDLVKIDIEGAEDALLAEENAWLHNVGSLLVEVHPNTTYERLNACLAPYGLVLRRLGETREPVFFASRS
jgi:FkbM family methyltransferase